MTKKGTTFRTSKGTAVSVTYPDIYIEPGFVLPEDVTNPAELRGALREELRGITKASGGGGLEYEVWFNKRGYAPHCAEHIIDPIDGKEKLLLTVNRKSMTIYDLKTGEIEWEYADPLICAQGIMLLTAIPGFGSAGDVCYTDKTDIIVVDRGTQAVKFRKRPPFASTYLCCVKMGVDNSSLIVTDFLPARVSKLRLPSLVEVWARTDINLPSKISVIEGAGAWHNPSFGGEYLVSELWNGPPPSAPPGTIHEIKDSDGSTVWRTPAADLTGAWINAPHSAFRMARIENRGGFTIVGSETGGGIYAVDYNGRPIWAIPSSAYLRPAVAGNHYFGTTRGLGEVTHVFPTLDSRIGFCAWSGLNSAIVGVITKLPLRQETSFPIALGKATTDAWVYLDPPIRAEEWDETLIVIKNTGATNSLNWKVDAYPHPAVNIIATPTEHMVPLLTSSAVAAAGWASADLVHPYLWYRVAVQNTVPGSATTCSVYISQRRK